MEIAPLSTRALVEVGREGIASNEGLNLQRLFVAALDSDQPPKVLVQGLPLPTGQVLRLIDPTRLVDKLQQRRRAQNSAGGNSGQSAANSRATHDLADLQQRLLELTEGLSDDQAAIAVRLIDALRG